MATVFINYRREDAAGEAQALFKELCEKLGADAVFMDVETIALGRDFREVLTQRLASVDVMLTLIGKGWLESRDKTGKRRLDDPNDFVRREIQAALERNIAVTPVLLQDAQMPAEADLPTDISGLAFRNAFELSHARWGSDVNELFRRLGLASLEPPPSERLKGTAGVFEPMLAKQRPSSEIESRAPARRRTTLTWAIAWTAVVLLAAAGGYLYFQSRQQAKADLEEARARQAEAVERAASEAAARQRAEDAQAEARRVAEAKERADQAQTAAAERERLERQARLERERAAAKEQAARDQAARAAAAKNQAAKGKPSQPTLPDGPEAVAHASGTANVDAAEAERRLTDIRAGRFSGSLALSLGDYAVAWGIAPGLSIGQPIPARALSGGVAARPCGFLARQISDVEREDFLSTCLALPSYGMQAQLALGVRPSEQAWMRFCTSRADAADAGGDARMRIMRTCLRFR